MSRLLDALLLLRHGWRPCRWPSHLRFPAVRWRVLWRDPSTGHCWQRETALWLCAAWRRRKGLS